MSTSEHFLDLQLLLLPALLFGLSLLDSRNPQWNIAAPEEVRETALSCVGTANPKNSKSDWNC